MKRALLLLLSILAALSLCAETVTIRRDARGIPYITARNERDLFYAQGYVTASDRLFQMEVLRRTVRGELAEILGKEALEDDKRRRTYGFAQLAESGVGKSSPEFEAALRAYADGVNAYIAGHRDALPAEFTSLKLTPRPWTPADSLAIAFLFAEGLSTTWPGDIAVDALKDLPGEQRELLFPATSPLDLYLVGAGDARERKSIARPASKVSLRDASAVVDIQLAFEASNNWVVSGSRTVTGKPMLANDPHLSPSAPSIWYLTSLHAPTLHAAGVTTPGLPGIILGHNEHIAWGCTNLGPDVQDLYRETFDPANPHRYRSPVGWLDATVRKETIAVRDSEPVTIEVVMTRHGPIVFEGDGGRFALQWTALDPTQSSAFDTFYQINRARNWTDFRRALRNYSGATQNFVYADRAGNIGYYGAGRIPVRARGDGSTPLDGATSDGRWTKFIPFERLPHLFNPPSGIIITANQRIAGPAYPYLLTAAPGPPYRARRIHELLSKKTKLTLDDLRAAQADAYSYADAIFIAEVAKMAKGRSEPEWKELAALDSAPLPLVMAMRQSFRTRILNAAIGADRARSYRWPMASIVVDRWITERPAAWLPKEFASYDALVLQTYADAKQEMGKNGDKLRPYRFPHSLGRTRKEWNVEVAATSGGSSTPVNAAAGVSMRLLADLSNWDATRQHIALGQSGDPSSPHWRDQLEGWLAVQPPVFPWSEEAVRAAARASETLDPR